MEEENVLYGFGELCATLKIPKKGPIWQEITHTLTVEEQLHNIEFTKEGVVYTDPKGNKWLGYVYKKFKALGKGGKDDYPKMHLWNCGVTKTWGEEPYVFSNTIPIECYNTSCFNAIRILPNIEICQNCFPIRKSKGWKNFRDAKQFVKYIRVNYNMESSQVVNCLGFTKDWFEVKEKYLQDKGFRCEHCGRILNSVIGRTFLHVYHVDRDLVNNETVNLRSLCTRCYCNSSGVEMTNALKKKLYAYQVYLGEKDWEEISDEHDRDLESHPYFQRLSTENKIKLQKLILPIKKSIFDSIRRGCFDKDSLISETKERFEKYTSFMDFLDESIFYTTLLSLVYDNAGVIKTLDEWILFYKNRKPRYVEQKIFGF